MTCINCGNPKARTHMGDYITSFNQAVVIVNECVATAQTQPRINKSATQFAMEMARRRDVDWDELIGGTRYTPVLRCREDISLALRNRGLSFPEIAKVLCMGSHSTVYEAHKRALKRAKELV